MHDQIRVLFMLLVVAALIAGLLLFLMILFGSAPGATIPAPEGANRPRDQ
jgi:hypothetical protein